LIGKRDKVPIDISLTNTGKASRLCLSGKRPVISNPLGQQGPIRPTPPFRQLFSNKYYKKDRRIPCRRITCRRMSCRRIPCRRITCRRMSYRRIHYRRITCRRMSCRRIPYRRITRRRMSWGLVCWAGGNSRALRNCLGWPPVLTDNQCNVRVCPTAATLPNPEVVCYTCYTHTDPNGNFRQPLFDNQRQAHQPS